MCLNRIISIFMFIIISINIGGDIVSPDFISSTTLMDKRNSINPLKNAFDSTIEEFLFNDSDLLDTSHCHLGHCSHIIIYAFTVDLNFMLVDKSYIFEFKYSDPFLGKIGPPPRFLS